MTAAATVLASGSEPAHPPGIAFNGTTILDSDDIVLRLASIPGTILIVGAGVIGIEFASMFAALGSRVTVVDLRPEILDFADRDIVEALRYHLRDINVTFRLGERVERGRGARVRDADDARERQADRRRRRRSTPPGARARRRRSSSRTPGSRATTAGGSRSARRYRTAVPHIWAAGDVVGFPSLAATSAEQGRIAAADALGLEVRSLGHLLPFGIYAIPEISYVGKTEEELTAASIPYESGVAHYRELARGHIMGETHGMLKLLVSPVDGKILGVHAFGTGATEVVHIGQAVMGLNGTIDYLVDAVFNYPTLAEAYKVAALDAANKLRAVTSTSVSTLVR